MKELVIISGKGGTGKTSITGAFASLASNMVLCDADVDADGPPGIGCPVIVSQPAFNAPVNNILQHL